ncbi:Two-component signal transduction system YycFG, regulatory protein YycH [Marinococcus luteus]|uniref:Two-component signal transduction system YycFG, regulatory protein YycH n=1 Tax=Marinococcus luteus TaxID=1122204 RepID=A0A1H2WA42_9BACI|nr:two-component system activity regulator YycH [Marinococcus luteus]SDW77460.1 Two-component signal transduction system YycFG, regulatory protein YycH [Marinococcus luteus]
MKETIKSWTLSILVIGSLLLTWQNWSFQPEYENVNSSESVQETTEIAETREAGEVVRPTQGVVRSNGSSSLMTEDQAASDLDKVYHQLGEADITETSVTDLDHDELYQNASSAEYSVELVFPSAVSWSMVNELFSFEDESNEVEEALDGSIDRILLTASPGSEELNAVFVSYDEGVVVNSNTNLDKNEIEYEQYLAEHESMLTHDTDQEGYEKHIYLPQDPGARTNYTYASTDLSTNEFQQVLIADENAQNLQTYTSDSTEVITDGTRELRINNVGDYLRYANPTYSEQTDGNDTSSLISSFEFVNNHAGWSDEYRYYSSSTVDGETTDTFRMNKGGLPVFRDSNGSDFASIQVSNVGTQTTGYSRPLFDLENNPVRTGDAGVSTDLPTGEETLDAVQEQCSSSLIEDIQIGYSISRNGENSGYYDMEPGWFVRCDGSWSPVEFGGDDNEEGGE